MAKPTRAEVKRMIAQREREIRTLEAALQQRPVAARLRKSWTSQLHGCKMNRQSWIDYLEKECK
jgi:hypothetical protein